MSKVLLTGDAGVGKTSILHRLTGEEYTSEYYPTMCCNVVEWQGFRFYDTAGDPQYGRGSGNDIGSKAVIYVIDLSRPETCRNLKRRVFEIREYCRGAPILIVGNKMEDRTYDAKDVDIEVSAAQNRGISDIVHFLETRCK